MCYQIEKNKKAPAKGLKANRKEKGIYMSNKKNYEVLSLEEKKRRFDAVNALTAKGMTQKQAAEKLGYTAGRYYKWRVDLKGKASKTKRAPKSEAPMTLVVDEPSKSESVQVFVVRGTPGEVAEILRGL